MLLNYLIPQKAQQTREEAVSFESSLASQFRSLTAKSGENLLKVEEQVDLVSKAAEKENDVANRVAKISALFSKNSLLETLVYAKINQKLDQFPKKTEEDEVKYQTTTTTPKEKKPKEKKPKSKRLVFPQKKLASGGISPPNGIDNSNKFNAKAIPYADILTVSLQASGIASITTLGEFIKGTGALGGFFAPYLKSLVKPFGLALGVSQNIINSLLGGPVHAASLDLKKQQAIFGKTWGKFLNDDEFIDKFIDRMGETRGGRKQKGFVPANWKDDPEFTSELNRVAQKFNINANDLLAVMLVETGGSLDPSIRNSKSGATGLIQFMPSTARGLGTTTDELARMTRAEQMKYVEKYMDGKLPQGATGGQIYTAVFLPAFINEEVLTVRGEDFYESNTGLDYNNDGKITRSDLDDHVEAKKKQYKLNVGGSIGKQINPLTPYLASGSESGFPAVLRDGMGRAYNVTLHGNEVIVPFEYGVQVYPVKNRSYDITKDPLALFKRWKDIANNTGNKSTASYSSGGTADFWKMAAISATEDKRHPQGQADVAQSIYNRAAIGSYPGGRDIGSIITAEGQYEPTFGNLSKWKGIRDRKSAIVAVGSSTLVDMAARSISSSTLQREAAKFVSGRTDFQGESQKTSMKPGDITRGKNHNFFGWFYDARLPKPAAIPKFVSSQTAVTASSVKPTPKVVVNKISAPSQPNIIQQAQGAVMTFTNMIFNPHRVKRELNMRRAR